jgi:hypothetical protein
MAGLVLEQFGVAALLHDLAAVHDDDAVGVSSPRTSGGQ